MLNHDKNINDLYHYCNENQEKGYIIKRRHEINLQLFNSIPYLQLFIR